MDAGMYVSSNVTVIVCAYTVNVGIYLYRYYSEDIDSSPGLIP